MAGIVIIIILLVYLLAITKDAIVPFGLDKRLPPDTLYMVFEEDYRFFPPGEDPDGADTYGQRVIKMMSKRAEAAQSSESPPPQTSESLPPQGKSSGKGKPKPESRFHASASRGSSDLADDENEGFSSNLADLVRHATVAHRLGWGNLIWVGWVQGGKNPPASAMAAT